MIKRFGSYAVCALVALFATTIGLVFHRYNAHVLSLEALDTAQTARNIAQGHGFSTSVIGVSQLSSLVTTPNTPDLLHAPLFPFLLGWAFTFGGERDGVILGFTLTLYVLSAVLLFILAKRLLQSGALAAVIAVAFSISLPVLAVADSGQSEALSGCLLLLILLILTPKTSETIAAESNVREESTSADGTVALNEVPALNQQSVRPSQVAQAQAAQGATANLAPAQAALVQAALEQEAASTMPSPEKDFSDDGEIDIFAAPPQPPDRRLLSYLAIGFLAGLCYLSDYVSLFYLVPLLVFWGEGAPGWRLRRVLMFALGFLVVALPWWIRNARLIGNPFYSLQWVVLSGQIPGVSLLETQLKAQIIQLFYGTTNAPHIYLMPFVVLSLWIRFQSQMVSRSKTAIWLALTLGLVSFSVFDPGNPLGLVPLAPLLVLLGFVTFFQIVSNTAFYEAILERLVPSLDFEPNLADPTIFRAVVKAEAPHPLWTLIKLRLLALFRIPLTVHVSPEEEVLYGGRFPFARIIQAQSIALLFVVLCFPVAWQLSQKRGPAPPDFKVALQPLTKVVSPDQVVVTDIPQLVAWYSDHKTTLIPRRVSALIALNNQPTIGALYLSGQSLGEGYDDWTQVYGPVELPGYQRLTDPNNRTVVYAKRPSEEQAQRLVQKQPQNVAAYLALGQALLQGQQFQRALDAFTQAERLQPTSNEAVLGSGGAYLGLGRLNEAQTQLAKALRLAPRSVPAMMGLAQVVQAQGKPGQAIALYEKVLSDSPNYPLALNNLAQLYADQNQNLYRALELARRAISQNPTNSSMLDTAGSVCLRLGYREEAIRYFQQAIKLSPKNQDYQERLKRAQSTP